MGIIRGESNWNKESKYELGQKGVLGMEKM